MSATLHAMKPGRTIAQLRMLVANAQTRIDELSAAMESMSIELLTPAWRVRCEEAEADLKRWQRLLAAYQLAATNPTLSPATIATETEPTVSRSLDTTAPSPANPIS